MGKTLKAGTTQKGQNVQNFTEDQARDYFEKLRWPEGPVCVHCGSTNIYRLQGKSTRPGLLACREKGCRKQFTVSVGSVMEDSHLPLATWARAFHFMCASKKGVSALQLQRTLGLGSYRTAWFLAHRIREAMRCEPVAGMLQGQIQVDETYVGGKSPMDKKYDNKTPVLALVETNGRVRSKPIDRVTSATLRAALQEACDPSAQIVTDDLTAYQAAAGMFTGGHETVNHSHDEYSRMQFNNKTGKVETITTNTVEAFFSLLKRGVYGTFHHVSKQHLHRYCNEFDFRWNGRELSDKERLNEAVKGAEGKRLMYKEPVGNQS